MKKLAAICVLSLISTSAVAITIDPNEYFAYSQPFHGDLCCFYLIKVAP
jgi:hypothetical protein